MTEIKDVSHAVWRMRAVRRTKGIEDALCLASDLRLSRNKDRRIQIAL